MPKRTAFLSFLALAGFSVVGSAIAPQPVQGQALAPYTIQLDEDRLEQQGFFLFHSAVEAFQRGDYDLEQATIQIQLASQVAPGNPQILSTLGELYNRQGEFDQSIEVLNQARLLEPENPAILFELGTAHLRKEDYGEAVKLLEAGLEISPNVFGALFDLGNAYYQLKQYESAISSYEQAVEVKEDLWFAVNNIGLVLYEQQDTKGAIEYWERSIDMTNRQEAEPLLALAVAQFQQGDRERALTQGVRALVINDAYADLEFLRENLWGDRLLTDTEEFLHQPEIQSILGQSSGNTHTH